MQYQNKWLANTESYMCGEIENNENNGGSFNANQRESENNGVMKTQWQ